MLESLYEKDVVFYFNIGEPNLITGDLLTIIWRYTNPNNWKSESDTGINDDQMNVRAYSQLTDAQRTALKGRPQLGEVPSITIRLKESKEFKVNYSLCGIE